MTVPIFPFRITAVVGANVLKGGSGGGGGAGIAFDAESQSGTASTNNTTWSHTVGSGSNRFLRVCLGYRAGTARTITGVTFNSVAMTHIASAFLEVNEGFGNKFGVDMWGLVAPDSGAHNIVITASAATDELLGGADSWTGVHQTTPTGTAVTGTGTTSTPSINVTVGTGEVAVAALSGYPDTGFGTGNTETANISGTVTGLVGSRDLSTGTVNMNFTGVFASGAQSAMSGVNIKPA